VLDELLIFELPSLFLFLVLVLYSLFNYELLSYPGILNSYFKDMQALLQG